MAINETRLQQFVGQVLTDLGAAFSAPLVLIGDRLGLYRAMADSGPLTPEELAEQTGTDTRYVREWLCAQAASGYTEYDEATGRFHLSEEQALVLAREESPAFMAGAFEVIAAGFRGEPRVSEAFRTGGGVGWHEHDTCLFRGTERFFRTGYRAQLVSSWLPALDGVAERLTRGATVADVGCGHGASTVLMAQAYPQSRFWGFDYHEASIERAREVAREAGVEERVSFQVAGASDYPGADYDFVTFFDCLHDLGDPVGAASHVRETLAADGAWMIVEPFAGDRVAENLNPVGRIYYSASTLFCTPASRSQEVGLALGAQAGEARLREVVEQGGFTRMRRAAETPFNLVLEVRH